MKDKKKVILFNTLLLVINASALIYHMIAFINCISSFQVKVSHKFLYMMDIHVLHAIYGTIVVYL